VLQAPKPTLMTKTRFSLAADDPLQRGLALGDNVTDGHTHHIAIAQLLIETLALLLRPSTTPLEMRSGENSVQLAEFPPGHDQRTSALARS
jgi:hypothetical protein